MRHTKPILYALLFSFILITACTSPPLDTPSTLTTITPIPLPNLLEAASVPTITASPLPPLPATHTPLPTSDLHNQPTLAPRSTEVPPTATAVLFPTDVPVIPTAVPVTYIQPTYAPDDPIYSGLSIDDLAAGIYGQGTFSITETLSDEGLFMRYQFSHPSEDRQVTGFLNVPHEGDSFPVVILLHGYVNPADYELLAYTTRYADELAEAGYMVFHPSYRHHPLDPADPPAENENIFRIAYAVDALNLLGHIESGSRNPTGPLRRADANNIHLFGHSMGGGIAQRLLTVRPQSFRAAVLYGSMSGDEARNYEKIRKWGGERAWEKEVYAHPDTIQAVSPIYYMDRWRTPVSIHHGTNDELVPVEWSQELCQNLKNLRHPVECFDYTNYPHTFYGAADAVFIERVITFFKRY